MRIFRLAQIFEKKYKIAVAGEDSLQKTKSLLLNRVKVLYDVFHGVNFEGRRKAGHSPSDIMLFKLDKESYKGQTERVAKALISKNNSERKELRKSNEDMQREIQLYVEKREHDFNKAEEGKKFLDKLEKILFEFNKIAGKFNVARIRDQSIYIKNMMDENSKQTTEGNVFEGVDKLIQIAEPPSLKKGVKGSIKEEERIHVQAQLTNIFNLLTLMIEESKDVEEGDIKLTDPLFEESTVERHERPTRKYISSNEKISFIKKYGNLYDISSERELDRIENIFTAQQLTIFYFLLNEVFERLERKTTFSKLFLLYDKGLKTMISIARDLLSMKPTNEPELYKPTEKGSYEWRAEEFDPLISDPSQISRPLRPPMEEVQQIKDQEKEKRILEKRKELEDHVQGLKSLMERI